jgi:Carboxypeptidase regulatory-like domain
MLSRRVTFSAIVCFCVGLVAILPPGPTTSPAADPPRARPRAKALPQLPSSLRGRITDEAGAPVADAELQIYPKDVGGRVYMAKSKPDGSYVFPRVASTAVYRLSIFSKRCVSLFDYRDDNLNIPLDPPKTVTRDFVLKPACQLRLTVVDEDGRPISKVTIFKPGRYDGQFSETNKEGQITLGGMPPSPLVSHFALQHKDFAFEFLDIKLDDPKTILERKVTLTEGKSVRGTVTCSDGKPAFGCTILALPSSWEFNSFPLGQPIRADGSFELPHIGPGAYKISISVPQGGGSSTSSNLMSDVELFNRKEPLALKADFPSPASMGFIEGRIRYAGGRRPKQGFWIQATSPARIPLSGGHYVQANENTFKIGPLPAGQYTLRINSPEIESKQIGTVAIGTKNIELEVQLRASLKLKGQITGADDGQPLQNLRIRLLKTQYLRGSNYSPNREWQPVSDPKGAFSVEVPGPGVYVVEASADGYAISSSEPVNTDTELNKELPIKLSRGLSLSGTVVDEAGRPINGATVLARSRFGDLLPVSGEKLAPGAGVATSDGRFRFDHLSPGKETLRALHRDYAFAEIKDLELKSATQRPPVTITMKRGGTVRGRVFDPSGRPAAGVPLHFRNTQSNDFQGNGEFASGVSDEAGEFEVGHLPETLIYIHRGDEWNSLGVVRLAVLPSATKSLRVDFGGIKKVTGRLLVNGTPVANTKLQLSGESPNLGIMRAFTMTDGEGNFVFRGIPPGERFLYYSAGTERRQQWVRVKPLRIETSNDAFGTINLVTATLTVRCPGADGDGVGNRDVWLTYYDLIWFSGQGSPAWAARKDKNEPFVFQDLPIGKYALNVRRSGKLGVRQVIEISESGVKALTLDFPKGTASIHGTVDTASRERGGYLGGQLRSKDNRLFGQLDIKPNGTFEVGGLPAGEYYITQQSVTNADALATFSLAEGEKKSIALADKLAVSRLHTRGFVQVRPYTVDGLPLPGCQVTLTGPKGEIPHQSSQSAQISFSSEPGPYRLSVAYPGFAPVTRQVEVKATEDGRWGQDHEINVTLVRLTDQTRAENK